MMSAVIAYPHIEKIGDEPARLRSTPRVRVAQIVMDYLFYGWSADEMVRQHSYLTPAEAHAALPYYFDHQQEIDEEIEQEVEQDRREAQAAAASPSPFVLRMRAEGRM